MRLFCYGTLQVPQVWRLVAGALPDCVAGTLPGHACHRLYGKPYPAAVPRRNSVTPGLLCEGVTPRQLRALDAFEGAWYRRRRCTVMTPDKRAVRAWVYVLNARQSRRLEAAPWDIQRFVGRDLPAYLARIGGRHGDRTSASRRIKA